MNCKTAACRSFRHQAGVTMIELLTALGIIAVMAMIALPAYDRLMQRYESHSVARHIQEAIRRAKIEAALHQKDVIVCTTNDAGVCDRFGQNALMVFVDKNRNNRPDAADVMALNQPLQLQHGMLSMNVSLSRHYIKFMGDNAKPRGHIGNIRYCSHAKNSSLDHKMVINMHGLVRVERGDVENLNC